MAKGGGEGRVQKRDGSGAVGRVDGIGKGGREKRKPGKEFLGRKKFLFESEKNGAADGRLGNHFHFSGYLVLEGINFRSLLKQIFKILALRGEEKSVKHGDVIMRYEQKLDNNESFY